MAELHSLRSFPWSETRLRLWKFICDIARYSKYKGQTFYNLGQVFVVNAGLTKKEELLAKLARDLWADIDPERYDVVFISGEPYFTTNLLALIEKRFNAQSPQLIELQKLHPVIYEEQIDAIHWANLLVIDEYAESGNLEKYFDGYEIDRVILNDVTSWIRDMIGSSPALAHEIIEGLIGSSQGLEHAIGFRTRYTRQSNSPNLTRQERYLNPILSVYSNINKNIPNIFKEGEQFIREVPYSVAPGIRQLFPHNVPYEGQPFIHQDYALQIGNFEIVPPNNTHIGYRRTDLYSALRSMLQSNLSTPIYESLQYSKVDIESYDLLQLIISHTRILLPKTIDVWRDKWAGWLDQQFSNAPYFTSEFRRVVLSHTELCDNYERTFEARARLGDISLSDGDLQDHANLTYDRFLSGLSSATDPSEKNFDRLEKSQQDYATLSTPTSKIAYLTQNLFELCRRIPCDEYTNLLKFTYDDLDRKAILRSIQILREKHYLKIKDGRVTWGGRRIRLKSLEEDL